MLLYTILYTDAFAYLFIIAIDCAFEHLEAPSIMAATYNTYVNIFLQSTLCIQADIDISEVVIRVYNDYFIKIMFIGTNVMTKVKNECDNVWMYI